MTWQLFYTISCPLKILKETVVFYYVLYNLLAFKDDFPLLFLLVVLPVPLSASSRPLPVLGEPRVIMEKYLCKRKALSPRGLFVFTHFEVATFVLRIQHLRQVEFPKGHAGEASRMEAQEHLGLVTQAKGGAPGWVFCSLAQSFLKNQTSTTSP